MRVVLDTNVLVRAVAAPVGPAGEVFDRISAGHVIVTSTELLAELRRALAYDRVRALHGLCDAELDEFVESLEAGAVVVSPPSPLPRIVPHDPDDDAVVAAAIAGQADVICTRNRHLLNETVATYCRQHGIAIMDEIALLEQLSRQN